MQKMVKSCADQQNFHTRIQPQHNNDEGGQTAVDIRIAAVILNVKLEEKGIKKIDLRNTYKLNPKTVDSLSKNKSVTVDTIMQLCEIFDCQPGDLMEYVKDSDVHE